MANEIEMDETKMNDLQKFNRFLIKVANTDVGIRRKIISVQKIINELRTKTKPDLNDRFVEGLK